MSESCNELILLGVLIDWNHLSWPKMIVFTYVSYLTRRDPGKDCGTNKLSQLEFKKTQKEQGDSRAYVLPTSQNPSFWNPSWLSEAFATRKDPESELLARDNPETNPVTMNLKTATTCQIVLLGSLTLWLSTWAPLPNKFFCFVSTCVSSDNSFLSVRPESWKESPFL